MPGEAGAFTAGVGITWPNAPWSRKRIDLAEEEAALELEAARARYDAVANALRQMVQEAYIRVQSAAQRAALRRTSLVPQTLQALDLSRVSYQADRGELLDIIDNQRTLIESRLGYYRALAELEQARADLERAVGVPILDGPGIPAEESCLDLASGASWQSGATAIDPSQRVADPPCSPDPTSRIPQPSSRNPYPASPIAEPAQEKAS